MNTEHNRPGYLFVLPWDPTSGPGGVNEVVRNLCVQMERAERLRPIIMIQSWNHPRPEYAELSGRRPARP